MLQVHSRVLHAGAGRTKVTIIHSSRGLLSHSLNTAGSSSAQQQASVPRSAAAPAAVDSLAGAVTGPGEVEPAVIDADREGSVAGVEAEAEVVAQAAEVEGTAQALVVSEGEAASEHVRVATVVPKVPSRSQGAASRAPFRGATAVSRKVSSNGGRSAPPFGKCGRSSNRARHPPRHGPASLSCSSGSRKVTSANRW